MVRPARGQARQTAAQQKTYEAYSFPGPSLGWVSDQNIAVSQPGGAFVLENVFPTATGGILRRGCRQHVDLSEEEDTETPNVRTLFTYESGNASQLFACVDGQIYDVSVSGAPVAKYAVTSGYWSTARYTTTDDGFNIRGVNGVDTPWIYDGSTFDTSPALTFAGGSSVQPEDLSYTWVFKNRFFFIQKGTLDVWYLPVAQLGGELTRFSLGGVFPLGGRLVFGSTWSAETGNGLSSMCIFVTDQGEIAVYQGDNPGEANSWSRVGVYRIGKPMGPNSFIQRGGDIVVATDIGFVAVSQALQKDAPALSPSAMSAPIEDEWNSLIRTRYEKTWNAAVWTEGQMVAISLPTLSGQEPTWLVANARTGRWARFTGWDAESLAVFNGALYYGAPNGKVYQANTGGADDTMPYVGVYVPAFDQMSVQGLKTVHMVRPVIRSRVAVKPKVSVHADFQISLPPSPDALPGETEGVWGVAVWGTDVWGGGGGATLTLINRWQNVFGEGEAISVAVQITSASVSPIDAEFVRTDVTFTKGEMQA